MRVLHFPSLHAVVRGSSGLLSSVCSSASPMAVCVGLVLRRVDVPSTSLMPGRSPTVLRRVLCRLYPSRLNRAVGWSGGPGIVRGCRSTGRFMWFSRAILLVTIMLVGSGCLGPTYRTDGGRLDSVPALLLNPSQMAGAVPLVDAIRAMRAAEILEQWPKSPDPNLVTISVGERRDWWAVMSAVESATGWTYDPPSRSFVVTAATHSVDNPDTAGRPKTDDLLSLTPRPVLSWGLRFVRVEGDASTESIGVGGRYVEFAGSQVAGVKLHWSSVTERAYELKTVAPGNPNVPLLTTDMKLVPSGVEVEGLVARLPGAMARVDGTLTVSSFSGTGISRVAVTIPLQADIVRSHWVKVFRLSGADASVRASFKGVGLELSAGGENVEVWCKVD